VSALKPKTGETLMTKTLFGAALIAASLAVATQAAADTPWQRHHPRREEVNARLANQNRRIHEERREGDLTASQAQALHQDDRQIRQEERDMASQNGGHITRSEQHVLNQQENGVSQQIPR
jgi:hypothetical protein